MIGRGRLSVNFMPVLTFVPNLEILEQAVPKKSLTEKKKVHIYKLMEEAKIQQK